MDQKTLERIKLLHPKIRAEVLNSYILINQAFTKKGLCLRFSHTFRSLEEQKNLYSIGRSKPGKIVTNAKEGLSVHNYGLAFDIVILVDKDNNGSFETVSWDIKSDIDKNKTADWQEVVDCFKKSGWTWGGNWKSFPDYPHFEKTFGLSPKQLLAKYNSGDTFKEIINGKIYKWVNI